MRVPFTQVDAFTDRVFAGNPAAVMPLPEWLDDATLVAIAAENKLSETAFLVVDESGEADYELRWFTPTTEVTLCGHATLASGHVVLSGDPTRDRVRFRTRRAGILSVERKGDGYAMSLPAWRSEPAPLPAIVAALGLEESAITETRWHPHRYALIVVDNEETVRTLAPDFRALAAEGDVAVMVSAPGRETDFVSRVFVPGGGVDEDPVTGSAHAVMVPHWSQQFSRDTLSAYQASARGGRIDCTLDGDRVILSGNCATVIEGTFFLP